MTEHVVCRIEPCADDKTIGSAKACGMVRWCPGCRGDGTRLVELDWSKVQEIIPEFMDDGPSDPT